MSEACILCEAVADSARRKELRQAFNTPLLTAGRFVVVPSVGPLVPGHVMVVSREHHPSIASMGTDAIEQYEGVLAKLGAMAPALMVDTLETEHGGTRADNNSSPCILHTHVNIIPSFGRFSNILDRVLPLISVTRDLKTVSSISEPYVFVRRVGSEARIYSAKNSQPQMVRRLICAQLHRDDWNWAVFPQDAWIEQTIGLWNAEF